MTRITATNFMSFRHLEMDLNERSVVITGPNSAGKSNIGRIVDVVRSVIAVHSGHPVRDRLDLYKRAPRLGARRFEVTLAIELDQAWEKELVAALVRATYVCSVEDKRDETRPISRRLRDNDARRRLDLASLWPLLSGDLRVSYDAGSRQPWSANWEFTRDLESGRRESWSIDLLNGAKLGRRHQPPGVRVVPFGEAWQQCFPDRDISQTRTTSLPRLDFTRLLDRDNDVSFHATIPNDGAALPDSVHDLARLLGKVDLENQSFGFIQVMDAVLQRGIVLTDNRRLPLARSYDLDALREPADLQDGSKVPGELYRLKNGPLQERQRYENIREFFTNLVGRSFDVQATPDTENPSGLLIDVTLPEGGLEYPIAFSGAGRQEALVLSTLLAGDPGRLIVLDEPAVHIEPTLQRRLVHALEGRAQCIVITHSPDLVPAGKPADLMRIVRLAPHPRGSSIRRIGNELNDVNQQARWIQRLGTGDARSLLFAAGVVLCEGSTDVGALSTWWEGVQESDWISPSGSNIALVDVGGDSGFSIYIEFLNAFGIPWAIFADGPALSPGSKLHKSMESTGLLPGDTPSDPADFTAWKEYWQEVGVYSVAENFGNDGSKSGEFEAFLERLDAPLYERVGEEIGRRSKPRIGAAFASKHPMPKEIRKIYLLMRQRLASGAQPT